MALRTEIVHGSEQETIERLLDARCRMLAAGGVSQGRLAGHWRQHAERAARAGASRPDHVVVDPEGRFGDTCR